jgi:hypothetical protein
MDEYKPNSHKYKAEQKQLENREVRKVVTGKAQVKKKNEFANALIAEDVSNVKSYILVDVIIPAFKKLIADVIRDGVEMMLYGSTTSSKSSRGRVDYSRISRDQRDDRRDRDYRSDRFDYNNISFESRSEAEEARMQMEEMIERYGFVTVADFYDMADLTAPYTANKYGWTSVRNAEVLRARDGRYEIKLSRAVPIGN